MYLLIFLKTIRKLNTIILSLLMILKVGQVIFVRIEIGQHFKYDLPTLIS